MRLRVMVVARHAVACCLIRDVIFSFAAADYALSFSFAAAVCLRHYYLPLATMPPPSAIFACLFA